MSQSAKTTNKKKNKNEGMWILLLIVVVIIAIGLIVGLGMNKGKNNTNLDTQQGQMQEQEQDKEIEEEEQKDTYATKLEDGTRLNTSSELKETKTYKDLEISNIQFTEKNGLSVLLADVKNNATTTHEEEVVKIVLLGENDETIATLRVLIGKIEPGETSQINTTASADYANAKDFKVEASE